MTAYTISFGQSSSGLSLVHGDTLTVFDGGSVSSIVLNGGTETISSGGTAAGTIVNTGGLVVVAGGTATGTVVNAGGADEVYSGSETGTVVAAIANQFLAGGQSFGTTITSGGLEFIQPGGYASGTIILAGGAAGVSSGATAIGLQVQNGGAAVVLQGGVASGTVISSGGIEQVSSGGTDSAGILLSGGVILEWVGGMTAGTVNSGGAVISSGVVVLSNYGFVSAAPTLSGAVVSAGLTVHVLSDGLVSASDLTNGRLYVLSGGTVMDTTLGFFGYVAAGATVEGLVVVRGGFLRTSAGASVQQTVVRSGGVVAISTGSAFDTVVSNGGSLDVGYTGFASGTVLSGGGSEDVQSGGTSIGTIIDSGAIQFLFHGSPTGAVINSGGTAYYFVSGDVETNAIFNDGARIDLGYLTYSSGGSVTLDPTADVLTVTEGAVITQVQLYGDHTAQSFALTKDAAAFAPGTLVTLSAAPCFRQGTRLTTPDGDVAVEDLRIGDRLVTRGGAARPVRWIGRRVVNCCAHPHPASVLPIRIAARAFRTVPERDLFLSPEHAVFAQGTLIPVAALCNGSSVHPVAVDRVTYFHVELDTHDVVFAEGLAVETYLENGNRQDFDGAAVMALHPDFTGRAEGRPYAPYQRQGVVVEEVRAQLSGCYRAASPTSVAMALL